MSKKKKKNPLFKFLVLLEIRIPISFKANNIAFTLMFVSLRMYVSEEVQACICPEIFFRNLHLRTLPGRVGRMECTQDEAVRQTKSKAAFKVLSEFYACSVGVWDLLARSHSSMAPVSPQEAKCICAKLCHHCQFLRETLQNDGDSRQEERHQHLCKNGMKKGAWVGTTAVVQGGRHPGRCSQQPHA